MLHDRGFEWFAPRANTLFFLPLCVITLTVLYKSWRALAGRVEHAGIPLMMGAIAFRWGSAMGSHLLGKHVVDYETFSMLLQLDATVATFVSYLCFGYAVLRFNLFRVRGVIADMVLQGGFVVAIVGLAAGGVDVALRLPAGLAQRCALVAVALVPALLFAIARWAKPRVEDALLSPLDPRRALAKTLLERVVRASERELRPAAVIALTVGALDELTGGGTRFLRGPAFRDAAQDSGDAAPPSSRPASEIGPALAAHLTSVTAGHLHRGRAEHLGGELAADVGRAPGDVLVAVRRGSDLYGTLALSGDKLDREVIATAVTMAEHMALKLENSRLFSQMLALRSELDESRRLASLGAFAAAIAHDIRTPLTSVQMNVQILRGKVQLPRDDMEYFDIALDELKRLNASVQEILDYAKPVALEATRVELSGVADEAARRIAPLLQERRVSLETHLDADLPPVLADAQRLRQVLINLLDNAAQASNHGASILVSTQTADDGKVAVLVADSGRGIRAEDLPKIFEPFFTTRPDGTGLGLAIAQKLVRAHGGEIRVESSVGRGTTFTVLLPRAPAAA